MPTLRHLSPWICGTNLTQRVDTSKISPRKANGWTPENTPLGKFPKHLQDSPILGFQMFIFGFHTTLFVFSSQNAKDLDLPTIPPTRVLPPKKSPGVEEEGALFQSAKTRAVWKCGHCGHCGVGFPTKNNNLRRSDPGNTLKTCSMFGCGILMYKYMWDSYV